MNTRKTADYSPTLHGSREENLTIRERRNIKPLNGIGSGAGLNARDAATQRELRRVAVASHKLETIRDDCRCHMPATVYVPMYEHEGIAWNSAQESVAYENKAECAAVGGGDYIATVRVVLSPKHKYHEVTGELIEDDKS